MKKTDGKTKRARGRPKLESPTRAVRLLWPEDVATYLEEDKNRTIKLIRGVISE